MEIQFKHATLGYGEKVVLKDVNLTLSTGKTTCVIGKNGAGKTTLFKSLLGLIPVLSGEILFDGKNVSQWSRRKFARMVSYVSQSRITAFPYSALDVVLFGRLAHLPSFASPRKKDVEIAEECLELLNISHLRDRVFTHLSGGEQQMVIIARALAQQPAFLVMDEPTANLDFSNQAKIICQVNALKNTSLGVLMATHTPSQAEMCHADVIVIHNGTVWKQGNYDEIITERLLQEIYDVEVEICPACKQLKIKNKSLILHSK